VHAHEPHVSGGRPAADRLAGKFGGGADRQCEAFCAALPRWFSRTGPGGGTAIAEYLSKATDMKFAVDKATGMTIVRIYNSASGELVRQIPSEEIVRIAELLHQELRQSSVDVRA
jgi:hypothetical protein